MTDFKPGDLVAWDPKAELEDNDLLRSVLSGNIPDDWELTPCERIERGFDVPSMVISYDPDVFRSLTILEKGAVYDVPAARYHVLARMEDD